MIEFITTYSAWVYWSWAGIFAVHFILNYLIYDRIEKEEFRGLTGLAGKSHMPAYLLSIFTLKWPANYEEHERNSTRKMMRASNKISLLFIACSILCFFTWVCTYGR